MTVYTYQRFKKLLPESQLHQLSLHGVSLDLAYDTAGAEAVLFAYNGFYVELVVEKITDNIHSLCCFRSLRKLEPYLHQVDISEIKSLLACSK